ncbi:MAG: serine/threonine-protein kinase [Dokdonella sp.]
MQADRWERLEQVFAEALAQPVAARSAFLERRCADDAELRSEIEALLQAHDAPGVLDADPGQAARGSLPASLSPGARLGAWQVDGLIGRGGMGEVYLATRVDQAFTQRGALKLLRHEAAAQLERFHAERQILARLEHPGIARLLDGGTTVDGRPYTVMEYVEGCSLTDYCEETRANFGERLNLFLQVCEAVAFAHRNLVIHRDLKPDNILVDASGKVKLLDFGIAKLIDISAVAVADHTVAPYTPDYAAPEQLSGEAVTTGTDIYALGVVLFELLTGERPLRTRGLPSTHALRLALDRDAPPASRIARQNPQAPLPARLLGGDIDAIIAKCLRKEAAHRYETVNGLKLDVERHLHNEPVLAREGARLYVVGRLLQRYRWAVAGTCALIIALALGLTGTIWQARRAETQATRATAVLGFVEDLFEGNDPARSKGKTVTARELLDRGARRVDGEFAQQTELRAQLKHTIGRLYLKLGVMDQAQNELTSSIALTPANGSGASELRFTRLLDLARVDLAISETDAALALLDEASALRLPVSLRARAEIAVDSLRAKLLRQRGDDKNALAVAEKTYLEVQKTLAPDHPDAINATESYAELLDADGRDREALPLAERVAQLREASLGRDDPLTLHSLSLLSEILQNVDQHSVADKLAHEVLERRLKILGAAHPDTADSLYQVSRMLYSEGRYRESDEPLIKAIALLRELDPTDRNLLADAIHQHATIDYRLGNLDAAEKGFRESILLRSALYGSDHRSVLEAQVGLAVILRGNGKLLEAITLTRHVVEVRAREGGDTPERINALRALGSSLSANGEHAEAIERLTEAVKMALRVYGENHEKPQQTRVLLGQAYLAAGKLQKAADTTLLALAGLQSLHPEGHPDIARTNGNLARIELQLGHAARAVELSQAQYNFLRAMFPEADNPKVAETQGLLGECLLAAGSLDAGRDALESAITVLNRKQPENPQLVAWKELMAKSL